MQEKNHGDKVETVISIRFSTIEFINGVKS